MILYKVITNDRKSVMNLFLDATSRYSRTYKKGEIAEAEPNTLGIFCFTSKEYALQWIHKCMISIGMYDIIKVKLLTKPKRKIPRISKRLTEARINYFYSNILYKSGEPHKLDTIEAPLGTVCVKRVEVLT